MEFFTMGMFILDEIVYPDKTKLANVIGGAGTFAVQSAGMFLDPEDRHKACMIVDAGRDFPHEAKIEMDSWRLGLIWRWNADRLTTRALNTYLDNDERDFAYLTPKIRIEFEDFTPEIRQAKVLHLICSPGRCRDICLAQLEAGFSSQLFVWEPVPTECDPQNWLKCQEMFGIAHVISPNAKEAAGFLGLEEPVTRQQVEQVADAYGAYKGIFIVRCGAQGALVVHNGAKTWYRPYHHDASKVVDPTGGGNSFMGGLGISLASDRNNVPRAVAWGMVAAGIQIEQVGLARFDPVQNLFNGETIAQRLEKYIA